MQRWTIAALRPWSPASPRTGSDHKALDRATMVPALAGPFSGL
jgi:hypothetical protein